MINGQALEFGNPEQIIWIRNNSAVMRGEIPVCEVDWGFVVIHLNRSPTGSARTTWAFYPNCDGVATFIECPRCGRSHKQVYTYDTQLPPTEQWAAIEEQEIECYYCELRMGFTEYGTTNLYVIQDENQYFGNKAHGNDQ